MQYNHYMKITILAGNCNVMGKISAALLINPSYTGLKCI